MVSPGQGLVDPYWFVCSIEGGELFERVIDDDFVLTEKACAIFVRQICEGLDYIHSQSIVHLDMKASQASLNVHRTDCNRCRTLPLSQRTYYASPERAIESNLLTLDWQEGSVQPTSYKSCLEHPNLQHRKWSTLRMLDTQRTCESISCNEISAINFLSIPGGQWA